MADQSDAVLTFLNEYPAAVREIALEIRAAILSLLPEADETLDRSGRVVGYGFGSGYTGLICTIIPSKRGVKLGIAEGATLPDPQGLMAGEGKRHRYVALTSRADLQRQGLPGLLKAAAAAAKKRVTPGARR